MESIKLILIALGSLLLEVIGLFLPFVIIGVYVLGLMHLFNFISFYYFEYVLVNINTINFSLWYIVTCIINYYLNKVFDTNTIGTENINDKIKIIKQWWMK